MRSIKIQSNEGCGTWRFAPFIHMWSVALATVVALLLLSAPAESAKTPEARCLWVVRDSITSPEKVRALIDFADRLHYNILFVQVRGRGDAYYRSVLVPGPMEHPHIPQLFDPLAELIPLAHARGIEVHAWFNIYYSWSSGTPPSSSAHVLRTHPEWFMVSLDGVNMATAPIDKVVNRTTEGRYLSPGLPLVREHLAMVILEVVENYRIDGVHMDYVRYPGRNYDFHDLVRARFRKWHGADPRDIVKGKHTSRSHVSILDDWIEYRAGQVSGFVRDISAKVRQVDLGIRISAAVKPDIDEAYLHFGQDWVGWLREGSVDFVAIMSYFTQDERFRVTLRDAVARVGREKIIGGIAVYLIPPKMSVEQIEYTRELGLLGYCTFSYGACLENPKIAESLAPLVQGGKVTVPPQINPYLRKEQ